MISRTKYSSHTEPVSASEAECSSADCSTTPPAAKTWIARFADILAPAFRLHRYRTTHSRLLHCALGAIDREKRTC